VDFSIVFANKPIRYILAKMKYKRINLAFFLMKQNEMEFINNTRNQQQQKGDNYGLNAGL
jgi:hypothetical protein